MSTDSSHLTSTRAGLLSEDSLAFSRALSDVLREAIREQLISFAAAAHVDQLARGEAHGEVLADLVLCLVYRHEWPP